MANRFLRPSQFVTTYGVSSLIRIGQLHRVIPNLQSIFNDLHSKPAFAEQNRLGKRGLEKFRIHDAKLEGVIKEKFNKGTLRITRR